VKKILLIWLVLLVLVCTPVYARKDEGHIALNDADGTAITDYSLTSGVAVYSERLDIERAAGWVVILITEDKSGGAGDVDVSAEYSTDGTNYYTVYNSDMAGTTTAEGLIREALQNTTEYTRFVLNPGKYMRYKFDPDADSEITVTHIDITDR